MRHALLINDALYQTGWFACVLWRRGSSSVDWIYVLSGDAMCFDASVSHSYRRSGRTTCSALIFSVA